jgi:hypothetical protein
MHKIDDCIDVIGVSSKQKKENAVTAYQTTVSDIKFAKLKKYSVRQADLLSMTNVLCEIADMNNKIADNIMSFNYKLMHAVAKCVVPIIFNEVLDEHESTRSYYEECFTQQMMAMQIINLVKDTQEDLKNGQMFFPSDWYTEDKLKSIHVYKLKTIGDHHLYRAQCLTNVIVSGASAASFVSGLTYIYNKLFEQLLVST